jgi:zinc D-Ala-D-Ala carboxypeptidase
MDLEFLEKLDALRDKWGRPMVVNSGLRCRWWNEKVRGAKRSMHLVGKAVDIRANKNDAVAIAALAESMGFGGVEIGKGFVHVDTGPKRDWVYL